MNNGTGTTLNSNNIRKFIEVTHKQQLIDAKKPYLDFDSLNSWSAPKIDKEKNKSHIPWLKGK